MKALSQQRLWRIEQTGVPADELFAEEQPGQGAKGEVGTERQFRRPDAFADDERRQADKRTEQ